jgi:hypothetical protein
MTAANGHDWDDSCLGAAVVAPGSVQWAAPPRTGYLGLFSCTTPCLTLTVRSQLAARQVVRALSGWYRAALAETVESPCLRAKERLWSALGQLASSAGGAGTVVPRRLTLLVRTGHSAPDRLFCALWETLPLMT